MAVTRTFDFNPVWATPGVFSPGAGGVDSLSIAKYANGNLLIPFVDSTFVKYVGINAGTTITSGRISNDPPVFELFFDPESTVLLNGNIVTAFSMANSAVMFQITGPTILPASPVNEFSPVREDTTVTATGTVEKPTVAALSDGGFVVTWGRTDGADRSIFARRYNLDGNAIGGIITVDDIGNGINAQNARVVSLSGGGFAVVYERVVSGSNDIWFRLYDSNGAVVQVGGEDDTVIDAVGSIQGDIRVSPTAAGGFAVAYTDNGWSSGGTGATDVTVVTYNAAGGVVTSFQRLGSLGTSGGLTDEAEDIILLPSGYLVVANAVRLSVNDIDIRFSVLSPTGQLLATNLTGPGTSPAIARLTAATGDSIAMAWSTSEFANGFLGAVQTFQIIERLTGDGANDVIVAQGPFTVGALGGGGGDTITGGQLNDTLDGQIGDDSVSGGLGNDSVLGGNGSDALFGDAGADTLLGDVGKDTLLGGDADDVLYGGVDADVLDGGAGRDAAAYNIGTLAPVVIYPDAPVNNSGDAAGDSYASIEVFFLTNASAADTFFGGAAGEEVFGFDGNDVLFGNGGNDTLRGGNGADFILPGVGADVIDGQADFDAVFYGDSAAAISLNLATGANSGFAAGDTFANVETFLMTGFADTVIGADNAAAGDILYGLGGNDSLVGQGGFDYLLGGDGDDTLNGGFGFDLFTGGLGADRFVFNNGFEGGAFLGGGEVITDFQSGVDKIAFVGATSGFVSFTLGQNLVLGAVNGGGFNGGTGGPVLIYDSSAGALWFDSNGNGAGGLNYLASLLGTPALVASDFIVI